MSGMETGIDHLVLTVASIERTVAFYIRDPDANLVEIATY